MLAIPRDLFGRAVGQVADDLRTDPYLKYLLLLTIVLGGFWLWHRVPNFATRDEHSRLMDVLVAVGSVLADPSIEGLREGVLWSRVPFGATFYLFGLAILPVLLALVVLGQLDILLVFAEPEYEFGFYRSWHATPEWFWVTSIVLVRLVNLLFAVGVVYLTYRLAADVRDRATGRLSALLLVLTWGFLTITHEGGEDMPALFFVLLALVLLVRYVRAGERALFYAACAAGGAAIAFKLTAAPVVPLVVVGLLLRGRNEGRSWLAAFWRPRLIVGGALVGLVTVVLGFPTALVGGVEEFLGRTLGGPFARATHATGPDAPIWWWFLRGYFSGLGLPLFIASVIGVVASLVHLRGQASTRRGTVLVVTALALYLFMFSFWHDFRVHHLLPTFPLLAILLSGSLERLRVDRPALARPLIAVLLVTTGAYAVAGDAGYASMPRDQATAWLTEHADENDTMEVYRRNMQDAAVPHDIRINHVYGRELDEEVVACPRYIQLGYRDLLYLTSDTYYRNDVERAEYIRSLLDGEYSYEVVAEFGPRPPNYVPERPTPGSVVDLLPLGVVPQSDQYADEQELRPNQYTVILERTGPCETELPRPF